MKLKIIVTCISVMGSGLYATHSMNPGYTVDKASVPEPLAEWLHCISNNLDNTHWTSWSLKNINNTDDWESFFSLLWLLWSYQALNAEDQKTLLSTIAQRRSYKQLYPHLLGYSNSQNYPEIAKLAHAMLYLFLKDTEKQINVASYTDLNKIVETTNLISRNLSLKGSSKLLRKVSDLSEGSTDDLQSSASSSVPSSPASSSAGPNSPFLPSDLPSSKQHNKCNMRTLSDPQEIMSAVHKNNKMPQGPSTSSIPQTRLDSPK